MNPYLLTAEHDGTTWEPIGWTATHTFAECRRTWWVHLPDGEKVEASKVVFRIDGKRASATRALRYSETYVAWGSE